MTELSPKEELEQLEMSLMSIIESLTMKHGDEVEAKRNDELSTEEIEQSLIDSFRLITAGLRHAQNIVGALASQLHVLESLTQQEFELVWEAMQDVREAAFQEVMASESKDMSPVDFVDGILAKLNRHED